MSWRLDRLTIIDCKFNYFSSFFFTQLIFFKRYYLFYGVSSLAAQVDGIDAPPPPTCTSLIYLYSEMWRSFDVGLYNYIHRYTVVSNIRTPLSLHNYRYVYSPFRDSSYRGKGGEFIGGISCFVFVAIFHGKVCK